MFFEKMDKFDKRLMRPMKNENKLPISLIKQDIPVDPADT